MKIAFMLPENKQIEDKRQQNVTCKQYCENFSLDYYTSKQAERKGKQNKEKHNKYTPVQKIEKVY